MQVCITFIETLVHSIWQSALLYILFYTFQLLYSNIHPQQKRNFLFKIITLQLGVSIYTFYSIYNQSGIFSNFLNNSIYEEFQTLFYTYQTPIIIIYVGYVSFKIIQIIYQWLNFKTHYKKNIIKVNALIQTFTEQKAFQLGIKRKISIWYSSSIQSPITFGFFKPVILLPISLLSNISVENIEAIILHELTHIKYKDYLLNWLMVVLDIIYVFNPFMRIIINQIKLEREKNCDLQVTNFNYNKISYAETLLHIAQINTKHKAFQLGAVFSNNQLLKRIQFFCADNNLKFSNTLNKYFVVFSLAIAFFIVTCIPNKKINNSINYKIQYAKNTLFDTKEKFQFSQANKFNISKNKNSNYISLNEPKIKVAKVSKLQHVETLNYTNIDENLFKQISLVDTLQNTKEFIYNIETPEGKIVQSYKLIYKNEEWVLEPLWIMVTKNQPDSLKILKLDSLSSLFDNIQ